MLRDAGDTTVIGLDSLVPFFGPLPKDETNLQGVAASANPVPFDWPKDVGGPLGYPHLSEGALRITIPSEEIISPPGGSSPPISEGVKRTRLLWQLVIDCIEKVPKEQLVECLDGCQQLSGAKTMLMDGTVNDIANEIGDSLCRAIEHGNGEPTDADFRELFTLALVFNATFLRKMVAQLPDGVA